MSSRNAYLSRERPGGAPVLYRVLKECAAAHQPGASIWRSARRRRRRDRSAGFTLDYLEARNAETLGASTTATDGPIRLLVAARIGKTRLIDNIAV